MAQGAPQLDLELSADEPVAQVCVRLCDVASSGASSRISYQVKYSWNVVLQSKVAAVYLQLLAIYLHFQAVAPEQLRFHAEAEQRT